MDNFSDEFERIRKDRLGVVKSEVYEGIRKLVSQIYPDKAHFIYELLQNAEDAGAHSVRFTLHSDELVFCHDGEKQFDINDIRSITNIGSSTKENDYIKAGKFGIGFKSVYAFTNTPRIYCDTINFKIEELLLPTEIEPNPERTPGMTEFHFPFDSPKIKPTVAEEKIKNGLLEIQETSLLFLKNIDTIEFTLNNDREYSRKRTSNEDLIELVENNNGKIFKSFWRRFSRFATKNGKGFYVDVAFPLTSVQGNNFQYSIRNCQVFIMFPAKNERSNLMFYINAPFSCTPTRDSVRTEDIANITFIKELSSLIADVIQQLKRDHNLTMDFLSVLPLKDDDISLFYAPIMETINSAFLKGQFLPTVSGNYVSVKDAIMFHPDEKYEKIIAIEDLRYLFENTMLQFVERRSSSSRAFKFLKNLGIKIIQSTDVLKKISDLPNWKLYDWLSEKSNEELIEIYAYLSHPMQTVRDCVVKNLRGNSTEIYSKIQNLRIIKGADDEFHTPGSVRLPVEGVQIPKQYVPVHQAVLEDKDAVLFCKGTGIIEFNEKERQKYIETLEEDNFINRINSIKVDDDALEVARDVLSFYDSHKDFDFKKMKFLWTNTDSQNGFASVLASPQECFLDDPFIDETGFRLAVRIHGKKEISNVYTNLEEGVMKRWIDFLKKNGIYYSISVDERKNPYGLSSSSDYVVWNLSNYFELKEPSLNRYIWEYFSKSRNWKVSYEFRRGNRNDTVETTLLRTLRCSAWVLDKDGNMQLPQQVSKDTIAEGWMDHENKQFLRAIEFGKQQEIEKQQELERKQLSDNAKKEAALTLGFSSTKEALDAKAAFQAISELEKRGIDIKQILNFVLKNSTDEENRSLKKRTLEELIEEKEKKSPQENISFDDDSYYVPSLVNSRSKVRRAIDNEKEPHGKISFGRQYVSNKDEREFVGWEYEGKCQICGKIIVKKNRGRYFEAINLFQTELIQDKYLAGFSTGWNTLCLCPNCAAEYKYGYVSMGDFFKKVRAISIDPRYNGTYDFDIMMQSEHRVLHYTPNHLMSLQTALEEFEAQEDAVDDEQTSSLEEDTEISNETEDITDTEIGNETANIADTEIGNEAANTTDEESILDVAYAIPSGNKCPRCAKFQAAVKEVRIRGKSGQIYSRRGLVCPCGTVYFTRRLRKSLPSDVEILECTEFSFPGHLSGNTKLK